MLPELSSGIIKKTENMQAIMSLYHFWPSGCLAASGARRSQTSQTDALLLMKKFECLSNMFMQQQSVAIGTLL